jgi:NAD(P)-dependent dehydrogenase (short-subunit alcohol dehydrogenase family)
MSSGALPCYTSDQQPKGSNVMGILDGKNAIIYGGAGSIGASIGAAFAREGARVHLVGRSQARLDEAARSIDGAVEVAALDALDEAAVDAHVAEVVAEHGSVDVSLNLVSRGDVQGIPLIDMTVSQLLAAVDVGLRSNFITSRAAARQMTRQGSGVILHLNSASGAGAMPGMGSTGPADAATESYMRYLAAELGPAGVRVCGIWTAGVEETLTSEKIGDVTGEVNNPGAEAALKMIASMAALRRPPRLADVAETATFLASDLASGITGTMINVTCGLVLR